MLGSQSYLLQAAEELYEKELTPLVEEILKLVVETIFIINFNDTLGKVVVLVMLVSGRLHILMVQKTHHFSKELVYIATVYTIFLQ